MRLLMSFDGSCWCKERTRQMSYFDCPTRNFHLSLLEAIATEWNPIKALAKYRYHRIRIPWRSGSATFHFRATLHRKRITPRNRIYNIKYRHELIACMMAAELPVLGKPPNLRFRSYVDDDDDDVGFGARCAPELMPSKIYRPRFAAIVHLVPERCNIVLVPGCLHFKNLPWQPRKTNQPQR